MPLKPPNDPFATWAEQNVAKVDDQGFAEGEMKGYSRSGETGGGPKNANDFPLPGTSGPELTKFKNVYPLTAPFAIGDVVCLKSGSVPMTVSDVRSVSGGFHIDTEWFEGPELYGSTFHERQLRKDTPELVSVGRTQEES